MNTLHALPSQRQVQFFKVLPTPQSSLPPLQNYQQLLQILNDQTYLYVDFNKNNPDSLTLLQKTQTPIKHLPDDQDQDDHHDLPNKQIQSLGNHFILDMSNLSKPSYKMTRYVSEGKKLMHKKKSIDQLENDFLLSLNKNVNNTFNQTTRLKIGSTYRKHEQKNKKLQYSNRITPQKLEDYLESKEYRKIERKLQKSEKQLEKYVLSIMELKDKEKATSQKLTQSTEKLSPPQIYSPSNQNKNTLSLLSSHKRQNLPKSRTSCMLVGTSTKLKLPKLKLFNELLQSTLTNN